MAPATEKNNVFWIVIFRVAVEVMALRFFRSAVGARLGLRIPAQCACSARSYGDEIAFPIVIQWAVTFLVIDVDRRLFVARLWSPWKGWHMFAALPCSVAALFFRRSESHSGLRPL